MRSIKIAAWEIHHLAVRIKTAQYPQNLIWNLEKVWNRKLFWLMKILLKRMEYMNT